MRILLVEDNPFDAELVQASLRREGIATEIVRVDTRNAFLEALDQYSFDIILSDYALPTFDGKAALAIVRQKCPDIPFVFVSGAMGEDLAIELMKGGASDYVLKHRLARLAPVVRRAIDQAQERIARLAAERLKAEALERQAMFLEASPDATIITTSAGILQCVNRQTEITFGYSREELIGQFIEMLLPERFREIHAAHVIAFSEDLSMRDLLGQSMDLTARRKNGEEFPASVAISPIKTSNEFLLITTIRDITDRKRAEQELALSERRRLQEQADREKAEAVSKARSTFLSTMSHEIRTPMNAIWGYTQLMLRDQSLSESVRRNLLIINSSSEHLLALINDFLDLAKVDSGRLELAPGSFDLPGLARQLCAMFRGRADDKGLEYEVTLENHGIEYIVADENRLRQVLMNLLSNAFKFTATGHVRLSLGLSRTPGGAQAGEVAAGGEGLRLQVRVEDTGAGISPEEQQKLFEPFVQGRAGRGVQGGTGLGLAISRRFVRLMGGDITVSSATGKGTTLTFEIPVGLGKPVPTAQGGRVTGILEPSSRPPCILIADDVRDNRGWLVQLLSTIGFQVAEAENGQQAIDRWKQLEPALILMDAHMPVMDGLEAARRIRELEDKGRRTVIFVLTAGAMPEDRRVAFENGADDFISKPCPEDVLLNRIEAHLGIRFAREEAAPGLCASAASPGTDTIEMLRQVPEDSLRNLLHATLNGDKELLDRLIGDLEVKWGAPASQLQKLADHYEYDRLIALLEQLCQPQLPTEAMRVPGPASGMGER